MYRIFSPVSGVACCPAREVLFPSWAGTVQNKPRRRRRRNNQWDPFRNLCQGELLFEKKDT